MSAYFAEYQLSGALTGGRGAGEGGGGVHPARFPRSAPVFDYCRMFVT